MSGDANQFALLKERRFGPFFLTLFAGAANDNAFKFAFTILVTYQLSVSWMPPTMAGLVIGALFILPFLLFSATAGQITDKLAKTPLIRFVKNAEIAIMVLAAIGFVAESPAMLLFCTFLMGMHSTLFGPVKFSYLPSVLKPAELTGGTAMVEMGTFLAILLGNVAGGLLVAMPEIGHLSVAAACLVLAIAGRLTAQFIPPVPAAAPDLRINWNPISETLSNLRLAGENLTVFRSLLGISWMWFFGATFLSQFPVFAKDILHGNEQVASLLLVIFSVGIGIGSLLCETLGRRQVEIGLVPVGAFGMTLFAVDLYYACLAVSGHQEQNIAAFVANASNWRVMADLFLLSLFTGLYSVPMYALIQLRSKPTHRARIIAANNILNALLLIASALTGAALLHLGLSVPEIFLVTGLLNALVAIYVFMLVPEYFLRFLAWVLTHLVYRFRVTGKEHIPNEGAAVLICNHVSFVDAILLLAASPRPIRFVMDHRIFATPVLGWMFKIGKAIPIAPQKEDPAAYAAAFAAAGKVLQDGHLLAIFPEGALTRDGALQTFRPGLLKILANAKEAGVAPPVVPMALSNLWGSFFSRVDGVAMRRPFRRGLWTRVGLHIGAPVPADSVQMEALQAMVQQLLDTER